MYLIVEVQYMNMQHFEWDDHIWPFCTHKSQNPVIPHNNLWSAIYERPLAQAGGRSTTVLHRYGWSLGAVHLYSPHQLHAIDQDPMGVGCTSVTVGQYCPTHDMNMLHAYPHWSLTRQGYQLTKTVQQGGCTANTFEIVHIENPMVCCIET